MTTRAHMLSGVMPTQADWRAKEVGYWPKAAIATTAPIWHIEKTGKWSRVSKLHETPTGALWQALGNWGRTVPCGRP